MAPSESSGEKDETLVLLSRLRKGDSEALNDLMIRDLDWIRSYAHRHLDGVVRRYADTYDVVQEVMIKVLQHGPRFVVADRQTFRRLMARIVINTITSLARRYTSEGRSAKRERSYESDSALYLGTEPPREAVTEPPDRVARQEEEERIQLAMELLEARDQAILRLRDWQGLGFKEAGEQLDLTEDAARMCHKRAVQKLASFVHKLEAGQLHELLDLAEAG